MSLIQIADAGDRALRYRLRKFVVGCSRARWSHLVVLSLLVGTGSITCKFCQFRPFLPSTTFLRIAETPPLWIGELCMKLNRMHWRTFSFFAFVVALLLVSSTAAFAQSPEPTKPETKPETTEVEQLKKRLQQLEQTVVELKGQIDAIETKKKSGTPEVVQAKYAEPASAPAAAPAEPASTEPASPKAQDDGKGESTFEVYGFAMLDFGYQFKQNHPDWFDVVRPTKLPSFPNEFAPNGKVFSGVRQSRLGVKSSTPTKYGALKTQFEFELFGTGVDAGQTTFRLRHAYGELGQFGAGQTWSPFMDIDVFPNSLEYW